MPLLIDRDPRGRPFTRIPKDFWDKCKTGDHCRYTDNWTDKRLINDARRHGFIIEVFPDYAFRIVGACQKG